MPRKDVGRHRRKSMDADIVVGERVRARRNLIKMSQDELGGKLGVSFQQIQKYEKGSNRISSGRLLQIADALGCSVGDLLDGADDKSARNDPLTKFAASKDGVAIIEAMSKIGSPVIRRKVIQLAETLAAAPRPPTS